MRLFTEAKVREQKLEYEARMVRSRLNTLDLDVKRLENERFDQLVRKRQKQRETLERQVLAKKAAGGGGIVTSPTPGESTSPDGTSVADIIPEAEGSVRYIHRTSGDSETTMREREKESTPSSTPRVKNHRGRSAAAAEVDNSLLADSQAAFELSVKQEERLNAGTQTAVHISNSNVTERVS